MAMTLTEHKHQSGAGPPCRPGSARARSTGRRGGGVCVGGPAVNVQFELLSSPCRRPELVWWGRSREPRTPTALQTTPGAVQDGRSIGFHGAVHALSAMVLMQR